MLNKRRTSRAWTAAVVLTGSLGLAGTGSSFAQETYPSKPIRWVVGFPAGGGSDFLARTVATALSEQLGQPIIIDNRPGAAAMIGAELAARAPADGYTIWSGDMSTLIFNPMIYRKVSYKVSDFQPVGLMGRFNLVISTGTTTGIDSIASAVQALKKNPNKFSYGSSGIGTPQHFVMELFKKSTGVDMTHVPYRGMGPMTQDLMAGQIEFGPVDVAFVQAQVQAKAGKLKPLAVASRARVPSLPDVPTMLELGYKGVEIYAWQGLFVPASTPRPIVDQLSSNLQKALQRPDVRKALTEHGLEITPSTSQEFSTYIEQQTTEWGETVRASGIKLDM